MKVIETELPGVVVLEPVVHQDERGFFLETYRETACSEAGIPGPFVQDNHSRSRRGVLRGLHFQRQKPQGKLIQVVRGEVFDVAVDLRRGSPTFKQWMGLELSGKEPRLLYIPPGFAHGFCALSKEADLLYKCTDYYDPADEGGVRWNDPGIGIEWPLGKPLLSGRDAALPLLAELKDEDLPRGG